MSGDDLGEQPTQAAVPSASVRPAPLAVSSDAATLASARPDAGHVSSDADTMAGDASPTPSTSARGAAGPGTSVGRYVVLGKLGAGGMGVVYSAYDPELDRKVAIKLLLPSLGGDGTEGPRRLLREAQAMAKLSHPCVVAVHDVGTLGDRVYVAMEFVSGDTLRAWLKKTERSWREIVRVFVDAGRGLAAAHEEGIVHRDFKPDNVMVDARERVRVMDFGLAHAYEGTPVADTPSTSTPNRETASALRLELTAAGTVMGTPAYMAPEQFAAAPTDARTDQFSFCVALWEALHGERPFRGATMAELSAAVLSGQLPTKPGRRRFPRAVGRALERGLSREPGDRWPTMAALLEVLEGCLRSRARPAIAISSLIVGGGLVAAAWPAGPAPCTGARDRMAGVWDDERREVVRAAVLDTGAAFASDVWARVGPELDAWSEAWVHAHTSTCEATRKHGEQSETVMDLRMSCLHRAQARLDAAVGVLAAADRDVVTRAHDLVGALPDLSRCDDVEALKADVAPPTAEQASAVDAVRAEIDRSHAQRTAGRAADAEATFARAEATLGDLDYGPVRAELELERGRLLDALGRYEDAEAALRKAQALAAELGQREVLSESTSQLLYVLGGRQGRHDAALVLADLATALAKDSPRLRTAALGNLAAVLLAAGRPSEAEAAFRSAAEEQALVYGSDDPIVAITRSSLAAALYGAGKYAEAEAEERAALEIFVKALGERHPDVATARNNLAAILHAQDHFDAAAEQFREALAIYEAVFGPEHPDVANTHNNLGVLLSHEGKDAEAEVETRIALELRIAALGPGHALVGQTRSNLAASLRRQGKLAESEAEQRLALQIRVDALGPDHPDVAESRMHLANVLYEARELDEAEAEALASLEIRERALGAEHPDVAKSLRVLGLVLLEQGRHADAVARLQRARSVRAAAEVPPTDRAESAFDLARATWGLGDHDAARALAQEADEAYAAAGPEHDARRQAIRKQLATWRGQEP